MVRFTMPSNDKDERIKKMKKMGTRGRKCASNEQCTKKYLACKKKKSLTYHEARDMWECEQEVLDKYVPKARKKMYNNKNYNCIRKCPFHGKRIKSKKNIDTRKKCRNKCKKTHPMYFTLYNGKRKK